MADQKELKMALISGASHALEFKRTNPRASDEDAIQYISRQSDELLDKLNTEE